MLAFLVRLTLLFLTFFLVLAACTSLPSAQLATYLSVSEEAEESGKVIYGALNQAVEFNKNRASGAQSGQCASTTSNPTCFDPADFLASPPVTDPDIQARILALETVAAYNDTLVALNSGQTGAELTKKIEALTINNPSRIVTANVGCQMHIATKAHIEVNHWIELLDQ